METIKFNDLTYFQKFIHNDKLYMKMHNQTYWEDNVALELLTGIEQAIEGDTMVIPVIVTQILCHQNDQYIYFS